MIKKSEKGYGEVVKRKKPWKHNQTIQLSRFWRRERDSNPWTANAVNGFRDRPVRPLRHLSIFNIYYNSFRFAKIHFIFHIQKFIFVFFFYYGLKNCFSVQFLNIFFLPLFHFSSFFAPKKHYSIRNLTQKKVEKIVVFSTFSHMLFLM